MTKKEPLAALSEGAKVRALELAEQLAVLARTSDTARAAAYCEIAEMLIEAAGEPAMNAPQAQSDWWGYWTQKGRPEIANDYVAFQLAEKWAARLTAAQAAGILKQP